MSVMILTVDFLPGTSLKDAVAEAKQKALTFDVAYVKFEYNGATFEIGRNANVFDVIKDYEEGESVVNKWNIIYA